MEKFKIGEKVISLNHTNALAVIKATKTTPLIRNGLPNLSPKYGFDYLIDLLNDEIVYQSVMESDLEEINI